MGILNKQDISQSIDTGYESYYYRQYILNYTHTACLKYKKEYDAYFSLNKFDVVIRKSNLIVINLWQFI
jgi:hypothetical protein